MSRALSVVWAFLLLPFPPSGNLEGLSSGFHYRVQPSVNLPLYLNYLQCKLLITLSLFHETDILLTLTLNIILL